MCNSTRSNDLAGIQPRRMQFRSDIYLIEGHDTQPAPTTSKDTLACGIVPQSYVDLRESSSVIRSIFHRTRRTNPPFHFCSRHPPVVVGKARAVRFHTFAKCGIFERSTGLSTSLYRGLPRFNTKSTCSRSDCNVTHRSRHP